MKNELQTFPVSAGLLEPRHVQAIDPGSPWPIYLWFLEHVTRDQEIGEDFLGIVLGGRPVSIQQIAEELGVKERPCRRHLARLVKAGYIVQKQTGVGTCTYTVTKSKRWAWKRQPRAGRDQISKGPELQTSLLFPGQDESDTPPHQNLVSGSPSPHQKVVSGSPSPHQKVVSAEGGTRARSQRSSQESHRERGRSRATLSELPTDFAPKDSHRNLARELNLNLDMVFRKFCDHHASKGTRFKDWDRALNTWLRREQDFGGSGKKLLSGYAPLPTDYVSPSEQMRRLGAGAGR